MSTLAERHQELLGLEALHFVTGTFFELSAEKIGRLRRDFEKNRTFFEEIAGLYEAIRRAAAKAKKGETSESAGRSIAVAFTSNAHFYGSINAEVVRSFVAHVEQTPDEELLVIGRTGQSFMEGYELRGRACDFFSFEGDDPTREEIRSVLERLAPYQHVFVFHPSFVNVFTQNAAMLDITHAPAEDAKDIDKHDAVEYIFEPELSRVLSFFETRVRYLLFRRIMFEAELARTAARLLSMNQAEDRADHALSALKHRVRREAEAFKDARLLETFSGIAKFKK